MASGYVTSDGKDLDSRYLGINAKAKSASTADSAGRVTGSLRVLPNGNPITVQKSVPAKGTASYSVTTDSFVQRTDAYSQISTRVNNFELSNGEGVFAAKGTTVSWSNSHSSSITGWLLISPVVAKS